MEPDRASRGQPGGAREICEEWAGPKHFETLQSRNPQYHLLLGSDRRAQSVVLRALHNWLAPEG